MDENEPTGLILTRPLHFPKLGRYLLGSLRLGSCGPLHPLRNEPCILGCVRPLAACTPESPSAQRESFPQIDASDFDIVSKLVGGPRAKNLPFGNDIRSVGHAEGLTNVVIRDKDP